MPAITALHRLRQEDCHEFDARLGYGPWLHLEITTKPKQANPYLSVGKWLHCLFETLSLTLKTHTHTHTTTQARAESKLASYTKVVQNATTRGNQGVHTGSGYIISYNYID